MPNTYSVYGLLLISEMEIPELGQIPLSWPDSPETVHVRLEPSASRAAATLPLSYTSPYRTRSGAPLLRIHRDEAGLLLRFTDIADFLVHPSSLMVIPEEGSDPAQVRQFLLGPALAVELELQGVPCLHASAVAVDRHSASLKAGGAVGFLAASMGGKSVLASSFMEDGAALLTDDILPLRRQGDAFIGSPGYPQMKVWPMAARELLGDGWADLDRIIPDWEKRRIPVGPKYGAFCSRPQPLLAIYTPVRDDGPARPASVEIAPLCPGDALIELVRNSFCARPAEALGWQPRRLSFLAEMVQRVPVRRLRYPSGFEHLRAVRDAILADIERLAR